MGRKLNPDLSYLEIEKLMERKKGKALDEDIEEVPFDVSDEKKTTKSTRGLNLVRPVPKKGTKFEANDKSVEPEAKNSMPPVKKPTQKSRSSVPDVILRKPSSYYVDDGENGKYSMLRMKPNLSLKMGKETQKDRFSDITLLKKPEPMTDEPKLGKENGQYDSNEWGVGVMGKVGHNNLRYEIDSAQSHFTTLLQKPELDNFNNEEEEEASVEHTEFRSSSVVTENNLDGSNSDNHLEVATGSNPDQFPKTRQVDTALDKGFAAGS